VKVSLSQQELEEELSWSSTTKIICIILHWVNLSPSFLFLQRLLRSSRVKRMTKVLNKQTNYKQEGLFKKDRNYELKWTVTSDKSKLFLNIVNTDETQKNFLNWELPFPQKFLISSLFLTVSRQRLLQPALQNGDPRPVANQDHRPPQRCHR